MEKNLISEEIQRLSAAFSNLLFITPAEFVINCDALLPLMLTDHSDEEQLRVFDLLEMAVSVFQASIYPATLPLAIFDPPNVQPESWTMMAFLIKVAENAVPAVKYNQNLLERWSRIASQYSEFCPSSQRTGVAEPLKFSIDMDVDDVFHSPIPAALTDFSQLCNPLLRSFLRDAPLLEATSVHRGAPHMKPPTPEILYVQSPRAPSLNENSLLQVISSPSPPSEFAEFSPAFDRSFNKSTTEEAISACPSSLRSTRSYASGLSTWSSSCSAQSFFPQSGIQDGLSSTPSMLYGLFSPLRPTHSKSLDC